VASTMKRTSPRGGLDEIVEARRRREVLDLPPVSFPSPLRRWRYVWVLCLSVDWVGGGLRISHGYRRSACRSRAS
jgi:hypothetical protein